MKAYPPLTRATLRGVWSALIVPWTDRDALDSRRFVREIRSYGGTGVHGVYTGGTTGEFYAQDDETYTRITQIACEEAHDVGLPVQIGASALSTRTACQRIRIALRAKADAIQIALPFWIELKDDEVKRFVRDISEEAGKTPIILYLVSRSKRKIAPPLLGEIAAETPTLIGTKDGCDIKTLRAMLKEAPDLAIFGGEDFYERIPAGGRGGYCSITGFNARKIVELYDLCSAGRMKEAKPLAASIESLLNEALIHSLVREEGLWDSAVDRILRVAGGQDVGLRCQLPYRSGKPVHVAQLIAWCRRHTPDLLPLHLAKRG